MTHCIEKYNIKSSVYNQTGESYVNQLNLHRTMCEHIRRVLGAKSVVDTRNARYTRSLQQGPTKRCRPAVAACKLRIFQPCPSDETIDKLAYDTEHHPSDNVIQIQCRKKSRERQKICCKDKVESNSCPYCQPNKDCPNNVRKQTSSKECYNNKPHICKNPCPSPYLNAFPNQRRASSRSRASSCQRKSEESAYLELECNDNTPYRSNRTSRKCEHEAATAAERRVSEPCPCPEATKNQPCPVRLAEEERKIAERCEEEARYAKFIYDITQDILKNDYHTDEQMKEVFEKHLQRNANRLNRRKMLYEIYQLKISLNILDDSDEEDEQEANLVYAAHFSSQRGPKPPTPPKCLNDNKVIEKLESYKNYECNSECSGKCVVLVDANPEILITERDVLYTLMDNDVDPQQIERIHKNLFRKAKDLQVCEVSAGNKVHNCLPIDQIEKTSSANEFIDLVSRERVQGILRKDCKSHSSVDKTPRRQSILKSRQEDDAVEKCAKWKLDTRERRPTPTCSPCSPSAAPAPGKSSPIHRPRSPHSKRERSPARTPAMSPARARARSPVRTPAVYAARTQERSPVRTPAMSPARTPVPSPRRTECRSTSPSRPVSPRTLSPAESSPKRSLVGGKPLERRPYRTPPSMSPTRVPRSPRRQVSEDTTDDLIVAAAVVEIEEVVVTRDDSLKSDDIEDDIEEELDTEVESPEKKKDYEDNKDLYDLEEMDSSQDTSKDRCSTDCKDEEKHNQDVTDAMSDIRSEITGSTHGDVSEPRHSPTPSTGKSSHGNDEVDPLQMSSISWGSHGIKQRVWKTISENLTSPEPVPVGTTIKLRRSIGTSGMNTHNTWKDKLSEFKTNCNYCQSGCRTDENGKCSENCRKARDGGCNDLDGIVKCLSSSGETSDEDHKQSSKK